MSYYTPDRWVLLKIKNDGQETVKVFAGWYGGYLGSDAWQLNSGVASVEKAQDGATIFHGVSGSEYICHTNNYGMTALQHNILSNWQNKLQENGVGASIEVLSREQAVNYMC